MRNILVPVAIVVVASAIGLLAADYNRGQIAKVEDRVQQIEERVEVLSYLGSAEHEVAIAKGPPRERAWWCVPITDGFDGDCTWSLRTCDIKANVSGTTCVRAAPPYCVDVRERGKEFVVTDCFSTWNACERDTQHSAKNARLEIARSCYRAIDGRAVELQAQLGGDATP